MKTGLTYHPTEKSRTIEQHQTTLLDRVLRSIWFGAIYMPEYSSENRVAGGRELKKELAKEEHDR